MFIRGQTYFGLVPGGSCLGCSGLHLRHTGLHVAGQMRHDAQYPLHKHELAAMMHLVFFDANDHIETRSGRRLPAGRHGHHFTEKIFRKGFHPGRELFPAFA